MEVERRRLEFGDARIDLGPLDLEHDLDALRVRGAARRRDLAGPAGGRHGQQQLGDRAADGGGGSEAVEQRGHFRIGPGHEVFQRAAHALADRDQRWFAGVGIPRARAVVVGEDIDVTDAPVSGEQQQRPVLVEARHGALALRVQEAAQQAALEVVRVGGRYQGAQARMQGVGVGKDDGLAPVRPGRIDEAQSRLIGREAVRVLEARLALGDVEAAHPERRAAGTGPDHGLTVHQKSSPRSTRRM